MKYVCDICGYVYDPEIGDPDNGIEAGTAFEALPEDWVCPLCGVGKDDFSPEAYRAFHRLKNDRPRKGISPFRLCYFMVKCLTVNL